MPVEYIRMVFISYRTGRFHRQNHRHLFDRQCIVFNIRVNILLPPHWGARSLATTRPDCYAAPLRRALEEGSPRGAIVVSGTERGGFVSGKARKSISGTERGHSVPKSWAKAISGTERGHSVPKSWAASVSAGTEAIRGGRRRRCGRCYR